MDLQPAPRERTSNRMDTVERVMLELLADRGTATACPSEIARRVGGAEWRARMPDVRAVAARLSKRGTLDAYQHGKIVDPLAARGPIRLRLRAAAAIDYRTHPERYRVGRGEEGVLTVEPYRSELLPLWRFRTPEEARRSAAAIWERFVSYRDEGDFAGMDMSRKYLQMGWTRARRYANHRSGRKYAPGTRRELPVDPDPEKAKSAAIFRRSLDRVLRDQTYRRLRAARSGRSRRHVQPPLTCR